MKLSRLLGAFGAVLIAAIVANAQVPGVNSTLNSVFTLAYDQSTSKRTYSAGRAGISVAAAATDVCVLQGSASATMRVRRIYVSGQTGTATADPLLIVRRSAANSGGTFTNGVTSPYDSGSAASAAVISFYTANPVLGAANAEFGDPLVAWGNNGTTVAPEQQYLVYGALGSPIFLRGASQFLALNLNGLTFATGTFGCWFEWTEDTDS